jgi:hypothetical protein
MEQEGSFLHSQEPGTCPVLSQINPIHTPISLSEIQFDIILPSMAGFSKWFFPSNLLTKTLCEPLLYLIRATCSTILLDLITRIIFGEEYRP